MTQPKLTCTPLELLNAGFGVVNTHIQDGIVYWNMDCRLEETCNRISSVILPYMIDLFVKIYTDVYGTTEYRSDFDTQKILANDGEQLLQNIFLMAQPNKFRTYVHQIIMSSNTYIPTQNDRFNLFRDDKIQGKRLRGTQIDEDELHLVIKQIFVNISQCDISELLCTH
jgi:hypothetical protein